MYLLIPVSYWLSLAVGVLATGFSVRIFIIQHDCGHGSFFKSKRANNLTGCACSLFTFIPYFYWRKQHALHHGSNGNLDKRGYGDMTVWTVKEYLQLSRFDRLKYRLYRNPFVFLILGPASFHLITNRLVRDWKFSTRGERLNVHLTNLVIAGMITGFGLWIGFGKVLMIIVPIFWMAGGAGIWLFYIQHQFEHTYWKRGAEWNYQNAALQGSSYFKLPRLLQYFTGNIGFHHVHHLKVNVPNYRLQQVFKTTPELQDVHTVTILSSIRSMFLSVWDEEKERLVSFRNVARSYGTSIHHGNTGGNRDGLK